MSGAPDVAGLLARLAAVEARLEAHAASTTPAGLTEPDEPTGEQWEAGQVWGHVAELVTYWREQVELVLAAPAGQPALFGRTRTDEQRLAGIEGGRARSPGELLARVTRGMASLRNLISTLSPEAWDRVGIHRVRGEMAVRTIVETFEVKHLEEHADQLDSLASRASGG